MIALIARALRGRPVRTWLAVAGIATSSLLVIVLAAALRGVRTAMRDYAGQPAVDLWIAPPGADNLIRGSVATQLPLELLDSLRSLPDITAADPLVKAFLPVRSRRAGKGQSTVTLLAIGYVLPAGLGGPPYLVVGAAPSGESEIVLDRAAAFRLGVVVGDTVLLGALPSAVSGLTSGTNILATQFLFGDFHAVASVHGSSSASLVAVRLRPGANPASLAQAVEARWPSVRAHTRDAFVEANEREVLSGFLPLLTLIAILGIGAACILVGLLVLSVVDERRSELALLMAMGTGDGRLRGALLLHASMLLALGFGLGSLLAACLAIAIDRALPTSPLVFAAGDVGLVLLAFGGAGLIAAVVPAAQLRRIDPLEAFRA